MPQIYLAKELYDKLIQNKKDVAEYVNNSVRNALIMEELVNK